MKTFNKKELENEIEESKMILDFTEGTICYYLEKVKESKKIEKELKQLISHYEYLLERGLFDERRENETVRKGKRTVKKKSKTSGKKIS